ncbi:FAD-dependent monooxygenase [Priestia megaterium]|uniref:FAD-dependent monooxygenase n=1 Tax=Priestia megaterium TaxID=1404 RepID=UPI001ADEE448|nr:FAD-dependent monooxygenase [Priestia megaterium]
MKNKNRAHVSELPLHEIQDSVNHIAPGIILDEPIWLSQFGTSHRLVPNYRYKNVFFIGDSAHIHNPAGGQGMNLGLQDVMNLVWKLELVIKGYSKDSILDTYHEERHFIASQVISATNKMMNLVTKQGFMIKRARRLLGKSVTSVESVKGFAANRLTGLKVNYRHSKHAINHYETALQKHALQAGDRVPNVYLFTGQESQASLYSIISKYSFTCFIYTTHSEDEKFVQAKKISEYIKEHFYEKVQTCFVLKNGVPTVEEDLAVLIDVRNELQRKCGLTEDSIIVLRQDGVVAFHQVNTDLEQCVEKLKFWIHPRS